MVGCMLGTDSGAERAFFCLFVWDLRTARCRTGKTELDWAAVARWSEDERRWIWADTGKETLMCLAFLFKGRKDGD